MFRDTVSDDMEKQGKASTWRQPLVDENLVEAAKRLVIGRLPR